MGDQTEIQPTFAVPESISRRSPGFFIPISSGSGPEPVFRREELRGIGECESRGNELVLGVRELEAGVVHEGAGAGGLFHITGGCHQALLGEHNGGLAGAAGGVTGAGEAVLFRDGTRTRT
jgi:hypothetical protein